MPTFELSLILRALQRPELSGVVKRCCTNIMDKGGIIRGMENLGLKPLPYKMTKHGDRFHEGNYLLIKFDSSVDLPTKLIDDLQRDTDIIRKNIFPADNEFVRPCVSGPCEFGELKNPDHEKRLWWARVARRHTKAERKKQQRKA